MALTRLKVASASLLMVWSCSEASAQRDAATLAASIEAEYQGLDNFDNDQEISIDSNYDVTYVMKWSETSYDKYVIHLADIGSVSSDGFTLICRVPGCIKLTKHLGFPTIAGYSTPPRETEHIRSRWRTPLCFVPDTMQLLASYWRSIIGAVPR